MAVTLATVFYFSLHLVSQLVLLTLSIGVIYIYALVAGVAVNLAQDRRKLQLPEDPFRIIFSVFWGILHAFLAFLLFVASDFELGFSRSIGASLICIGAALLGVGLGASILFAIWKVTHGTRERLQKKLGVKDAQEESEMEGLQATQARHGDEETAVGGKE